MIVSVGRVKLLNSNLNIMRKYELIFDVSHCCKIFAKKYQKRKI